MESNLGVLRSDGVGSAVRTEALNVLQAMGEKFGHSFNFNEGLVGGVVRDTPGKALGYETIFIYDCRIC